MTDRTPRPRFGLFIGLGLVVALVLIVAVTAFGGGTEKSEARLATGPAAPVAEFAMFDGSTATFAAYTGRPVVVNFWASWCPSCVAEMSAAFRPAQQHLGDEVAFLGLNIQDDHARAIELVEETGVLFDLGEDPIGDIYTELGGIGMPFTVFINEFGEVVHEHNGPLTEGQLEGLIRDKLLTT